MHCGKFVKVPENSCGPRKSWELRDALGGTGIMIAFIFDSYIVLGVSRAVKTSGTVAYLKYNKNRVFSGVVLQDNAQCLGLCLSLCCVL